MRNVKMSGQFNLILSYINRYNSLGKRTSLLCKYCYKFPGCCLFNTPKIFLSNLKVNGFTFTFCPIFNIFYIY